MQRLPHKAVDIERQLLQMTGITNMQASPLTGNVLVLFGSKTINRHQVLFEITSFVTHDCDGEMNIGIGSANRFQKTWPGVFAEKTFEFAMERAITAML